MITPERWQEIKEVLAKSLETDPADRSAYLDKACGVDSGLRKEIERLLEAEKLAGTNFLRSPEELEQRDFDEDKFEHNDDRPIGQILGKYRILECIGEGGMGTVYCAARADDQYQNKVAIKLIHRGTDSAFIFSRFKNERQILASLNHPNIAHLLDGGTTDEGAPYFVMDLIEGETIDKYCDHHNLNVDARLQLFVQVCGAVQYAHRHLIIHRDIKPHNILVTDEGVPKLLDFGIAKVLDSASSDGLDKTTLSLCILTPAYASPEQLNGESITTLSDVYSLGVVLYELLTGHRPYRVSTRTPEALSRAVREQIPEKPSTVVRRMDSYGTDSSHQITPEAVSAVREGSPDKLSKRLTGDLDKIVLTALRKEPERRYSSVEQLAEDVVRHLKDLPVTARGDAWGYRAKKFVTRHKTAVLAAALVAATLVAGIAITLREARIARAQRARAERRFSDVRKLANSLIFEIHDSVEAIPGATATRKLIVDTALQYLDSLASESTGDLSLQSEVAAAYQRVGVAQGGTFEANLGDSDGALKSFQKALEIRKQIYAAGPNRLENTVALAESYRSVSDKLLSKGQTAAAYDQIKEAVKLGETQLPSHANDTNLLQELARDYLVEADLLGANFNLSNMGDAEAAFVVGRKNVQVSEHLARLRPEDTSVQREAVVSIIRMGDQFLFAGRRREALDQYLHAKEILERLVVGSPTAKILDNLHGLYQRLSAVQVADSNYPQALGFVRSALEISNRLSAADPKDKWARLSLAGDYSNLADTVSRTSDKRKSFPALEKTLDITSELIAADPHNPELQGFQSAVCSTAGDVYRRNGRYSKAIAYYNQAQSLTTRIVENDPNNTDARRRLAANYNSLGVTLIQLGNTKDAINSFQKALALVQAEAASQKPSEQALYSTADSITGLGNAEVKLVATERRPNRQLAHWKKAVGLYEASLKTWDSIREPGGSSPDGYESIPPAAVRARLKKCQAEITVIISQQNIGAVPK